MREITKVFVSADGTVEKITEMTNESILQSEPTPIEPTLEEKYEELQSLVAELLEVVSNG
jgi:uncharacterized protein YqgV (UPF0045/DUF77 family)